MEFCSFITVIFFKSTEKQTKRLKIHFVYQWSDRRRMGLGLYTMSYIDFKKLINSLKYKSFKCLLYRDPRKSPSRGLKPLNFDFDILQLAKDVFGFDVVEVYVDQGVIDTSSKNLNDVEDDEVVVIDGVEAEVKAMVEGEVEAKGQVDG